MSTPILDTAEHGIIRKPASVLVHGVPPRAARWALLAVFTLLGIVGANWFVRIPAIQDKLDISTSVLGLLLLGMPGGAVVSMPLAGVLVARFGSRNVTWLSTIVYCAVAPVLGLAPGVGSLAASLFLFGAAGGMMDVAINAQGVQIEKRYRRTIMSSFHAAFSLGSMVGAVAGGLIASAGVAPGPHLVGIGLVMGLVALAAPRWLLPSSVDAAHPDHDGPLFVRPPRPVLVLGLLAFCGLLAEGSMADWSAVYLQRVLETGPGVAAGGYAVFSLTMAAGRLSGDWLADRLGATAIVRYGSVIAAAGLALAVTVRWVPVTLLGFACVGAGLSVIVPLLFSMAGRMPGVAPGLSIAAVTTLGYLGFMAGPPVIGVVAGLSSLPLAFVLVMALVLLMASLAGRVRSAEEDRRS